MLDEVNQEDSKQDEVDGIELGEADSRSEAMNTENNG